ncbi:hypothetical protein T439DRAFT_58756 [Meredithblackwellia eburnea MCA 4105]
MTDSNSTNGAAAAPKLSAAQLLQQAHEAQAQNGTGSTDTTTTTATGEDIITDDPFPVDAAATSFDAPAPAPSKPKAINISDESAFPSLGGAPGGAKKVGSLWGAGASRIKSAASSSPAGSPSLAPIGGTATPASSNGGLSRSGTPLPDDPSSVSMAPNPSNVFSTRIQLATSDIHINVPAPGAPRPRGTFSNREPEPTTLGEVLKLINKRHPQAQVEASTSKNITTFLIRAKGPNAQGEVQAVQRELLSKLTKKVSEDVLIPAGLRALIIGAKGRTLKQITETTGANIQIPPRDPSTDPESEAPTDEFPDGPLIPVTVSGDSLGVANAKQRILAIVSERISKVQIKLDTIAKTWWPLLNGARGTKIAELVASVGASDSVNVFIPRAFEKRGVSASADDDDERKDVPEKVITVSGEREAAARVIEAINAQVAELTRTCKTLSISVNKRQHRFLIGPNADDLLEVTGCCVELPPVESSSEDVIIRGPQSELVKALGLVMEKSNATPIDTLDLTTAHRGTHDTKAYSEYVTRYVLRKGKFKALSEQNNVQVYLPRPAAIEAGTPIIEIVGKTAEDVAGARQAIIAIVRTLPPPHFAVVHVDSLIHKHLIGKKGSKIKAFEEKRGVEVVFPPDSEDRSDILLVYTGEPAKASEILGEVRTEIEQMAKEAADITTATLTIPSNLHRNIIGQGGTTLNAVIGEERLVNVSFGSKANGKDSANDDSVIIRGPSEEVARVKAEISRIAEEAKNSEIVNSHLIEFEVDTIHVRHVVGKSGAGINKLRDDLGVRVDFEELGPSGPKKTPRSKVTIKGRKENAEEARKRIVNTVDKIADEVTLSIPLPASLDRGSLIGKQGTYIKRLESTYEVHINFPRSDEPGTDIVIRGPQKGATAAKKELVDLIEFSKEHGHVVTFTVSVKSLPRILGKGGASINEIKEETQVSVDIDQESDEAATAEVTLRGTKAGTAKAKTLIQAIAKDVDDEARLTVEIPREFHTTLIGSGGSNIREIITKAGGPTDARASANAVRFPRPGDEASGNTVVITAPSAIAAKIKAALEKEVASLQSRVVWGVVVPHTLHASVIGKGASALQELQRKHTVKIIMPGWNDYPTAGEIANPEDCQDAPAGDVVKLIGPRESVVAAAADLSGRPNQASASRTISVPRKFHAKIAQGGRFFRSLPTGTRVTHQGVKPPSSSVKTRKPASNGASAARIDDDSTSTDSEVHFELLPLVEEGQEEDGEIPWVIESASKEDADKIYADIERQLSQATTSTHIGWVTVPRGTMPRIVGRGGAGLEKLRAGGVEVEVVGRKDANQLTLIGTPAAIEAAHKAIVTLAAPRAPRQYRDD